MHAMATEALVTERAHKSQGINELFGLGATRLISLDVVRGLAVAGMILVVSPGAWDYSYAALRHAEWYGWTLADMVFPLFLFAVGVAIIFSFGAHLARGNSKR